MGSPQSGFKYRPVQMSAAVTEGATNLAKGIKDIGSAFLAGNKHIQTLEEIEFKSLKAKIEADTKTATEKEKDNNLKTVAKGASPAVTSKIQNQYHKNTKALIKNAPPESVPKIKKYREEEAIDLNIQLQGEKTRQALENAVTSTTQLVRLETDNGNIEGAINILDQSYQDGILTFDQKINLKNECLRSHSVNLLNNDLNTDIVGLFNNADQQKYQPFVSDSELKLALSSGERMLSMQKANLPFTTEEISMIEQGMPVHPKQQVRRGASRDEYQWIETYNKTGSFEIHKLDIENSMISEIKAAPLLPTKEGRQIWLESLINKYERYGADIEQLNIMANQQMEKIAGLSNMSKQLDVDQFFAHLSNWEVVPDMHIREDHIKNGFHWFKSNEEINNEIQAYQDQIKSVREKIGNQLSMRMAIWNHENPEAGYSEQFLQASDLVVKVAKEMGYHRAVDTSVFTDKIIAAHKDKKYRYEDAIKEAEHQKLRYSELREKNKPHQPDKESKNDAPHFSWASPIDNVPVERIAGTSPAVYVSKEMYEDYRRESQGEPLLEITLSNKSFARLPIMGVYEGETRGIQLTSAARALLATYQPDKARVSLYRERRNSDMNSSAIA